MEQTIIKDKINLSIASFIFYSYLLKIKFSSPQKILNKNYNIKLLISYFRLEWRWKNKLRHQVLNVEIHF